LISLPRDDEALTDGSSKRTVIEAGLFCLTLFWYIYPDLLLDSLIDTQKLAGISGDIAFMALKLLLMGSVLFVSLPHWNSILRALWAEKLLLLLMLLALASLLWSDTPLETLRHAVVILSTTLIGCAFAVRFRHDEQIIILCLMFSIMIILSLIAIAVVPAEAVEQKAYYRGSWAGIQGDKNGLGLQMVFSSLVFVLLALTPAMRRWRAPLWIGAGVSIAMLMLSYSRTAMVAAAATGSALVLLMRPWKLQRQTIWLAASTGLVIVLLGASVFVKPAYWLAQGTAPTASNDPAAWEVGDLGTLVDRTLIWDQLFPAIRQRPLLGYGYNSFWPGSNIVLPNDNRAGSAHNGYFEIVLDLGLIGLIVFVVQLAVTLFRALRQGVHAESAMDYWPALFVIGLMVLNIATSTFMENTIPWIIYVSVAVGLAMAHPAVESADHA
jgi:exopolysaccharide production protein ExoQ